MFGVLGVKHWVLADPGACLSGSSVRQAHRVFSLLMETAARSKRLSANPAVGVKLPRAGKPEKTFLTHEQVSALADAAGRSRVTTADLLPSPEAVRLAGERRTIILVLSYCGLRWGELAALRVDRVDTMRRKISVAEAASEVRGKLVWGTPKTHQQRSVPIPKFPIPKFLVEPLDVLKAGKGPKDLIFTGARGGVLRNHNFRCDVFADAAVAVGLEGLTPHELRHTAASLAISSGANMKAVQRMLGHAFAAMTLDVYSGLFDDDLDGLAARLDEADHLGGSARQRAESSHRCLT